VKTNTGKLNPLDVLLQTKLHRPPPTRLLVHRQRLLDRLDKGKDSSLILVCAPAGYGKTTLVSSWIEGMQAGDPRRSVSMPAAWLTLDEYDSDALLFVKYLISALRTIAESACAKTLDLLYSPQQPSINVITTTLINDIVQLPGSIILVLDDYQNIQGQAVHQLLDDVLKQSSPKLHLVVISRTDPPLSVARLRANGLFTEIRSRDLRFTREEATEYLTDAVDISLSEALLMQLEERLKGWIAGLRLATLSLRSAGDANSVLTTLAGADTNITDYLADEVLARQLPAIQSFLLKTSILDRFNVSLCEAVVGDIDPAWSVGNCLDWLDRMELFIIPLDEHKQWFRYHPLFQDLLKQRLKAESGPKPEIHLHQRASAWFADQGLLDEAIQHALESGDNHLVARLMEKGLKDVLNREARLTLDQWVKILPEEILHSKPSLLMIKVWALAISWHLAAAMKLLHQVEAMIETSESNLDTESIQILRGQIATLRAQEAFFANQPARAIEYSRKGLTLMPESWVYVRGGLILYLGLSMQAIGQSQAAERFLFDQYEGHDDKTDGFSMRILLALSFNNLNNGGLEQSRQVAHTMLDQSIRGRRQVTSNWGHYFIGFVKYQWNELDAAEDHLTEIIGNRYAITPLIAQHGMTILARVHQAGGRSSEAWQTLETLSRFDLERIGYEENETRALRARLSLLQGKMGDAFRWADAFTEPPAERPLLWLENPHTTRAQILITRGDEGDLQEALKILDQLDEMAVRTYNTRSLIEIRALQALALDAQGRSRKADTLLKQALDLARHGGFIRVFLDLGKPMQEMLQRLGARSPNKEYSQRLLSAFTEEQQRKKAEDTQQTSASGPARKPPVLAEPLTAREMDVLRLLRGPLSNKEIASQLYLSPSTIKRHTINLYGKLGAHSRKEAVAAAIDLGILSPA
jgi:LuxR family maltose regulon positive regulatory protein